VVNARDSRASGPASAAAQAASFGVAAAEYERGRPSYPAAVLDWLVPIDAAVALDVGAGTGKLTRELRRRGLEVVAVDPSTGMLAELTRVLPEVPVAAASAEDLPLRDRLADVVLVAQAWHWVDPRRAVPEIARVLKPGGWLGLVWNVRDVREAWVARLGRILNRAAEQDMNSAAPRVGPPFGPLQRRDFAWTSRLTLAGLLDLVASRSYVITRLPDERAAILAAVTDLVERDPGLDPADIRLPYIARAARTRLPPNWQGS
jgi:SAM-dependent methyltransferase